MTWPGWNRETVARLKELWLEGKTATEIMVAMKAPSRASVRGKLLRLDLRNVDRDDQRWKGKARTAPRDVSKPAPEKRPPRSVAAKPPGYVSPTAPIPLEALGHAQCRWPLGDPRKPGFGFCGDHAPDGRYCDHHHWRSMSAVEQARHKARAA